MPERRPYRDKWLYVGPPAALAAALGLPAPLSPGETHELSGRGRLLWLRPEQWLLLPHAGAPAPEPAGAPPAPEVLVLDAGARFVEVEVAGPQAAELLATGCSLDLRERAFAAGRCAQSRIDRVPVILHREACDRFAVIVERPLARYLERWLERAAMEFVEAGESGA